MIRLSLTNRKRDNTKGIKIWGKSSSEGRLNVRVRACIFLQLMILLEESCTYKQHHNNMEYNYCEEGPKRCKLIPNTKLTTVPNPIIREETYIGSFSLFHF